MVNFIISREDWSLHRKGHMDQKRHQEKVKEAIKKNLADLVSEESIIMSDGKKYIKIPIRSLQEYRFKFNQNKGKHGGQGTGGTNKGDVIGTDSAGSQGSGQGKGAGEEPGVDYYEAEVDIEELEQMLFEDFELPDLKEKRKKKTVSESIHFNDIRKKGLQGNIDKKRTILENLKRNTMNGDPHIGNFTPEDLRYKTWEEKVRRHSAAVVFAMMDTSGSMGVFEKYIARTFFFWMVRFLRTKYQKVEIVYFAHHTKAKIVTEKQFFTKGESGGTRCSSVYDLALETINTKYNPEDYNIYAFHFTDGDNLPSDNEKCLDLVRKLVDLCNMVGYGEIINPYYRSTTLMEVYQKIKDHPRFVPVTIKDKSEIYAALKMFFSKQKEARA
ncbi:MAG: uncharacterized protein PWQ96_194 [Clostridia bacterium]|jgi:hypothetical protein|nr:hypothetical protein [Clostridiales bacterium]MDK2984552.1 uncharacterized protein [Clostridia bacterium]